MGQSGNPNGRPKGALNRRSQLAKALEPHALELIAKTIELGLSGDVNALRLCIERLIPKIKHEDTGIELPSRLNEKNVSKLKEKVLLAAIQGQMNVNDAEKLIKLIDDQYKMNPSFTSLPKLPNDPIEAAKIYQEIMSNT